MAQRRRTRAQWQRLVEGWSGSGLTQAQYCRRHGISVASLHRWRERLRRDRGIGAVPAGLGRAAEPVRVLPVELLAAEQPGIPEEAALRLIFAEGLQLAIAPGFDAPTLRRVVALLREHVSA